MNSYLRYELGSYYEFNFGRGLDPVIASLQGKLAHKGSDALVLMVGGVGYEVYFPASRHHRLPALGDELFLHVQTVVREDSFALYGFPDQGEKRMFQLLLGVSGVGPRLAMNILAGALPSVLSGAILRDDIVLLKKLPGVGKKTAERLCLELKDKMEFFPAADDGAMASPGAEELPGAGGEFKEAAFRDAFSALLNLGYPAPRARVVLDDLRRGVVEGEGGELADLPVEELLRLALRSLA